MKNAKKILITLLAAALLLSCFAFSAFADESASADEVAMLRSEMLEFYEGDYYLNAQFNNVTTKDAAFADASDEFALASDASYRYSSTDGATSKFQANTPISFDIVPDEVGSFGVNVRAKFTNTRSPLLAFYLHTKDRASSVAQFVPVKIFEIRWTDPDTTNSISYERGASLTIYDPVTQEMVAKTTAIAPIVSGTSAQASDYFELSMYFDNSGDKNVTLTITPEGGAPETHTFNVGGFDFKAMDLRCNFITFDYVELYEGSFPRRLAGNVNAVAEYINEIYAKAVLLPEVDKTAAYADIAKVLLLYGYSPASIADAELKDDVIAAAKDVLTVYCDSMAAEFIQAVDSINKEDTYNNRLDLVNSYAYHSSSLKSLETNEIYNITLPNYTYEQIAEKRVVYDAEIAELALQKSNTEKFVAAALAVPEVYLASYKDLRNAYDIFEQYPACPTFYDDSIDAATVELAIKLADTVKVEYERLNSKAVAFVESMLAIEAGIDDFATKYATYVVADQNYFTDVTYNEFITGTTIQDLNALYETVDEEITVIVNYADEFIAKVNEANLTRSYSVKNVALTSAATYIEDVERGYPGVTAALELYDVIREDVTKKIAATEAYINAVINVQKATTVADKIAAIETAKALAILGADVSVDVSVGDMSVVDANILLSNEESAIRLADARIQTYASAVEAIAECENAIDLRGAILNALAIKATVDASDERAAAITATLTSAVNDYNADMQAANEKSEEVNKVVLSTLSGTIPTQRIAEVVAIIKKFYE
ncbi:MAG: hypothetical protein E7617_01310 [Ruminococcaceae bacterium]|nr:hypothetical protein [Oscillospiraceae bacterium]